MGTRFTVPIRNAPATQRGRLARFTLAELLVTVGVLGLLVLLFTQLLEQRRNDYDAWPQTNGRRLTSATAP